jgi:hypothetical protein
MEPAPKPRPVVLTFDETYLMSWLVGRALPDASAARPRGYRLDLDYSCSPMMFDDFVIRPVVVAGA